jgi:hypothetical protein
MHGTQTFLFLIFNNQHHCIGNFSREPNDRTGVFIKISVFVFGIFVESLISKEERQTSCKPNRHFSEPYF